MIRKFGNETADPTDNTIETILNVLDTKPVPGRAQIEPHKYPPR